MTAQAVVRGQDQVQGLAANCDAVAGAGEMADGVIVLARSHWPVSQGGELPAIAGFVVSAFSPLAAAVADQCLSACFGPPPADPARADGIAIVLVSATGDLATAAAVASAVQQGRRVPPLLFYQSNPNAVAGYIAARWGLAGPVVCTIPAGDPLTDAMSGATLLIADGEAQAALIVVANTYAGGDVEGTALLIGPASWSPTPAAAHGVDAAAASKVPRSDQAPAPGKVF